MRKLWQYALIAISASPACGVAPEHARSWEGIHQSTFLPGYKDYRGEINGTDDGFVVMSYGIPDGTPTGDAIREVKRLVLSKDPCYSVLSESSTELVLRCPGGVSRNGFRWDEEYRVLLQPGPRRVVVLVLDNVRRERYQEFTTVLDRFRRS